MTDLTKKLGEMMERTRKAEAEIERLTSRVREAEARYTALMEAVLDWGLEGDDPEAAQRILRKAEGAVPIEAFLAKVRSL